MSASRARSGKPGSPAAGLPDGATDEALIGLVQSLPYASPRRAAAYEELVRRYEFVVKACVRRYRDSPESVEEATRPGQWATWRGTPARQPGHGHRGRGAAPDWTAAPWVAALLTRGA
jgi:hypothetical protein